ncbi:MAG: hypothetical protein H3C47_07170 [Candidatus Cloacimonetes bacterium]|nr:hypothetical protein [Candidatus Cloacimonadota bacterium]
MIRAAIFCLAAATSFADNGPLNKYKLMLNQQVEESALKKQVFDQILEDIRLSQEQKVSTVNSWDDQKVMEHYGQMAPADSIGNPGAPVDPSLVRGKILKAMQAKHKEMAREIYSQIQSSDVETLKSSLVKTLELDSTFRSEAEKQYEDVVSDATKNGAPSAPYLRPAYGSYYNYYGYNYFYNYNYRAPVSYPYYQNPYYYTPTYSNGYYNYNTYNYNYYSYQNYYYPRYNRTTNLLATGVFGLAAAAAFVDWLKY